MVFAAVGFETTAPATAAAVRQAHREGVENFTVLASHKRVIPAMTGLLESGEVNVDGFLCPGHVSVIIGSNPYRPIVERYHQPCVITGFEELGMAAGLARLARSFVTGVVSWLITTLRRCRPGATARPRRCLQRCLSRSI